MRIGQTEKISREIEITKKTYGFTVKDLDYPESEPIRLTHTEVLTLVEKMPKRIKKLWNIQI